MSHHQARDRTVGSGIVPRATGRALGVTVEGGVALSKSYTPAGRRSRTPSPSCTKSLLSPIGFMRSSRTRRPRAVIIIGAAMLIKLDTTPDLKPVDRPTASKMDD
jgi:hypothetical protein